MPPMVVRAVSLLYLTGLWATGTSNAAVGVNACSRIWDSCQLSSDASLNPQKAWIVCPEKSIPCHSADINENWKIDLSELLRIMQFYNSAQISCQDDTEDGYAPGPGAHDCAPHDSDFEPQDWQVGLRELLRAIQFYNSYGYEAVEGTEDGFQPVPAPFSVVDVSPNVPVYGGVDVSVTIRARWEMSGNVDGIFKIESLGIEETISTFADGSGNYVFTYTAPLDADGPVALMLHGMRFDGKALEQVFPNIAVVKNKEPQLSLESAIIGDNVLFTVRYEGAWVINLDSSFLILQCDPDIVYYWPSISEDTDDPTVRFVHFTDIEGRGSIRLIVLPGSSRDRFGNPDLGSGPTTPLTIDLPRMNAYLTSESSNFSPGQDVEVSVEFENNINNTVTAFAAVIELPAGWTFVRVSGSDAPALYPLSGRVGPVNLIWVIPPTFPLYVNLVVHVPADFTDSQARLTAQSIYRFTGSERRSRVGELILSRVP